VREAGSSRPHPSQTVPGCGPPECRWHRHRRPGVLESATTPTPLSIVSRWRSSSSSRSATLQDHAPNTYYGQ